MSYQDEFNNVSKEARWTIWRVFLIIILPLMGLGILIGGINYGINLMSQPAKIIEKTLDADNVISNYEWFKNTYHDIQATDIKISIAQEDIKNFNESAGSRNKWTFEDKNESSRLSSVLTGLKNYRQDLTAQYNARAKMLNRKFFMGKDIPPEIN